LKPCFMKCILFLSLIPMLLLSSCRSTRQIPNESIKQNGSVFILGSIHLSRTPEGYSVKLTDLKKVDGSLKKDLKPKFWMENDFYCLVFDRFRHVTDSIRIAQPLNPRFEFPDENGAIGSKQVELQKTDVLIRFPMREKLRSLELGIVDQSKKFRVISSIDIPSKF
jgi:hypothetical protein